MVTEPYKDASLEEMERLVGRAMFDPDFQDRLLQNPQAAAGELGVQLSERQVNHILDSDPDAIRALGTLFRSLENIPTNPSAFPFW